MMRPPKMGRFLRAFGIRSLSSYFGSLYALTVISRFADIRLMTARVRGRRGNQVDKIYAFLSQNPRWNAEFQTEEYLRHLTHRADVRRVSEDCCTWA